MALEQRVCKNCEKQYSVQHWRKNKFCGRDCYYKSDTAEENGRLMGHWLKGRPSNNPYGNGGATKGRKATGRQLEGLKIGWGLKDKKIYKGEESVHWKGGKPCCIDCKKPLSRYTAKKCRQHSVLTGEANPLWRGGKGTERHRAMGRKEYKKLRELVFLRDDYTCQICESRGGYLHADHKSRWSEDEVNRFEINNLRTLCRACHYYVTFKRKLPKGSQWGITKGYGKVGG